MGKGCQGTKSWILVGWSTSKRYRKIQYDGQSNLTVTLLRPMQPARVKNLDTILHEHTVHRYFHCCIKSPSPKGGTLSLSKMPLQSKDSPIVIVGAGVFGLSSAINFAQSGYKNVTVFDQQPYHETGYDYERGCDAASADCNKIIRAAYGHEVWYQNLTLEAIKLWEEWNEDYAKRMRGNKTEPGVVMRDDRIYVNCGNYHFGSAENELNPFEKQSVKNIKAAGLGRTQYLFNEDPGEAERAKADGYGYAVDPFNLANEKKYEGYLDTIGGFVYADKACRYALGLAQRLGVRFDLDRQAGCFEQFVQQQQDNAPVMGIKTADGKIHPASLTIVACGGWTPGHILPEMDGLCETTAGSVATIQIPESSPLYKRMLPDNFPVFQWNVRGGENGSLYGFPLTEKGVLKIGYRGIKYTNPKPFDHDRVRSIPVTKWTSPSIAGLPEKSVQTIQKFLDTYIPELRQLHGIGPQSYETRLCWYTDSFDNQWVCDFVPGKPGVMVATGGSGHAFKFLPLLGRLVVERAESKSSESDLLSRLRWRALKDGEKPYNVLMKGFDNVHSLQRVKMIQTGDVAAAKL